MITNYQPFVKKFLLAAQLMDQGKREVYVTGTGTEAYDFIVDGHSFTVFKQPADRRSRAAQLARNGHAVYVIRDNDRMDNNNLIGSVDLDTKSFYLYNTSGSGTTVADDLSDLDDSGVEAPRVVRSGPTPMSTTNQRADSNEPGRTHLVQAKVVAAGSGNDISELEPEEIPETTSSAGNRVSELMAGD